MPNIGIITYEDDLHGQIVNTAIGAKPNVKASLFAVDKLALGGGLSWSDDARHTNLLKTSDNQWISPSELDVIWFRRLNHPMSFPTNLSDKSEQDFVSNEWRTALLGMLYSDFDGIWVNDPNFDMRAGNKLNQIRMAKLAGLNVPKTLISQRPEEVRTFCADCGGQIVVKKIMGAASLPTASLVISESELREEDSIEVCPAIYQEIIPGRRHLRVTCFGKSTHAVLVESDVFDWRRDYTVPFYHYKLEDELEARLHKLLEISGLKMGIFDLKISDNDDVVWLELNPQGQFAFCEALTGDKITASFADYLCELAMLR